MTYGFGIVIEALTRRGAMSARFGSTLFIAIGSLGLLTGFQNSPRTALAVVRHLTFTVVYDSTSDVVVDVTNFGKSGTETVIGPSADRKPTVSVDVVAAPDDGTLAADVSEVDGHWYQPAVRVGVTDKTLTYAPDAMLTEEERVLLHFLARDLIGPDHLSVGSAWHDSVHFNGINLDTEYHVSAIDSKTRTLTASLRALGTEHNGNEVDVTMSGSLIYDLGMLVPRSLQMYTVSTSEHSQRVARIRAYYQATLIDDSFAKQE